MLANDTTNLSHTLRLFYALSACSSVAHLALIFSNLLFRSTRTVLAGRGRRCW